MILFLDIETIPGQDPEIKTMLSRDAQAAKEAVRAPANYKDAEKIKEYLDAKHAEIDAGIEESWRRTALDGGLGQILMIGYAIDGEDPQVIWYDYKHPDAEAHVLQNFAKDLECLPIEKVVGHNLVEFDLRFIWQRSVVLGIRPPKLPFHARPWDDKVFDTMTAWAGFKNRISMDRLCQILGLEGKGEIDGSKVWDYVQAGKIEEVAEYCKSDVERTRKIYDYMNFIVRGL